MGLNLNTASGEGDFLPYVRYNAKAGRWYDKEGEELPNPTFVPDFEKIKTGWFYFQEGGAPDKVFDASLSEQAERPSENHKRGFEVQLFSEKSFGGVVEFSATANVVCSEIAELYEEYESKGSAKLPVVACTKVDAVKGQYGTNYKPVFKIEKWVERPKAFDSAVVEQDNGEEESEF